MMKRYLLNVLLGLVVLPVFGQGVTDYYQLPTKSQQQARLLKRYGGPAIQNRWYVAMEGFLKTDRAQLDNSFNELIESDRVTKPAWGLAVGWSYRERWAVEAGYARMPIHTQVSVINASSPLSFRYTNDQNAVMLRGKRLLISTSKPWLRSGFWLSGGVWAVPNNGRREGDFTINGYRYPTTWEGRAPVRLTGTTYTNAQISTLAEIGAEYNVRLSNTLDLGFSARKFFGLSNSITTNVSYVVNQNTVRKAQLEGTGTGMGYGVTLRYNFSTQRKVTNVLEVHGKNWKPRFE